MDLNCMFRPVTYHNEKNLYSCCVVNQNISEGTVLNFIGQHEANKTNSDVLGICFTNCDISKVPQGLMKIFPNLRVLLICHSKLKEVKNEDLVELKNIKMLFLDGNLIEHLPRDLFKGLERSLEVIHFPSNKLKFIDPTIFDGFSSRKLKHVNFKSNPKYSKCFSLTAPNQNNATLAEVKSELFEQSYSYLMSEITRLLNEKKQLEAENQALKIQTEKEKQEWILQIEELTTIMDSEMKPMEVQIEELKKENQEKCLRIEALKAVVELEKQTLKLQTETFDKEKEGLNLKIEELKALEIENLQFKEEKRNWNETQESLLNEIEKVKLEPKIQKDLMEFAQQDENLKDFTIIIDEKVFSVHKFVVAARCPRFAEIFENNAEADCLNSTGISAECFEDILTYFYHNEFPTGDDVDFIELFAVSGQLKVRGLMDYAAEHLMTYMTSENALRILKMSSKYCHEKLRLKAFEVIKKKHPDVELKDEWLTDSQKMEELLIFLKEKERIQKQLEGMYKRLTMSAEKKIEDKIEDGFNDSSFCDKIETESTQL